jgi:GT2 family glycosyltransferase
MTARPAVAVVVATYDRAELLADCLGSIMAELGEGDELFVAEAGDSQAAGALAALSGPARVAVVAVAPPGKSRQLNAAVARATAPIVLFTDDDCRVPRGWVDGLAVPFADPEVAIAFGRIEGLTHLPGSEEAERPPPGEAPLLTWTYAHGASYAVRRSDLMAIGGFDERLGPGAPAHGEEHDVLLRLRERGRRAVIAAAPAVAHLAWRSEEESAANALVYERGAGAFLGAAVRRDRRRAWPLLKHRLGYARQLVADRSGPDRAFARRAVRAFAGGLLYGLRLPPWSGPSR